MLRLLGSLLSVLLSALAVAAAPPVARPIIWVTAADRAPILAKIESQPWARASFAAMQARVRDAVAQHQQNPDTFLRGLPLVAHPDGPRFHPTLAHIGGNMASEPGREVRGKLQRFLLIGVDCGVLYFLTGDKAYARCAADILHATVEALVQMKPNESAGNGGWIYPDDHLYEARALGPLPPLIYDFVHGHLQGGATVHSLVSRREAPFDFAHAQQVFRTYARLAIEHGIIDCNWPVLEMPSLAHNVLALDDPAERTRLLEHVLTKNTAHQDSLQKVVSQFAESGAVWPESFQYSGGVSSLATYLVALMRRQSPATPLTDAYGNIPLSLARLRDFRFPNGENIRFGDGPRRGGESFDSYEIAYALGQREGNPKLPETFGALINLGIARGKYDRAKPHGHAAGASVYLGPLQLLWYAPEVSGRMSAPVPRVTDELPFVGALLQRNFSPDLDPAHAFMAVVSGGHHVHGHASGMALELYGAGQVLGANAGKGTYTTNEHENHRRLFAAYNTVIVNGASRSEGGWVNLGMNTVKKIALEPAVGAAPVSPRHSFTLTSFVDDKGPGAKATQERLVGLVRTSDSTGYYVDVFRSQSALPDQFHDYLYHNLGDRVILASPRGALPLAESPGRFVPVPGAKWERNHSYLFPGWHFFQSARTSAPLAEDVTVDFPVDRLQPAPAHMRLFIPGTEGREYSSALAPETMEAPEPYAKTPTPVLIIRQRGSAWERPFAVVYEPFAGSASSGSVRSVTALGPRDRFAGFQVVSEVAGRRRTQYVLVQSGATDVFEDPRLGISFRGRYAVITLNERDDCAGLYLGEGNRIRFRGYDLSFRAGATASAAAEWEGDRPTLTAASPAELVLPGGRRITAGGEGTR